MAWTTPRTWVAGEIVTAAMLNTHVRDNESFLYDTPACRLWNSAAISLTNNSFDQLTFDTEYYDNDTMHSTSTNTGRINIVTAGRYYLYGCCEFATNATGNRGLRIQTNTALVIAHHLVGAIASVAGRLTIFTEYNLAAGTWVALHAFQNSGAALNANSVADYSPVFGARRVGAYA